VKNFFAKEAKGMPKVLREPNQTVNPDQINQTCHSSNSNKQYVQNK